MSISQRLKDLGQKAMRWNRRLKPLYRIYLGLLLALGLAQGIIAIIVLLLGPAAPVGSR